ncbi:MAG: phosphoribosylaminoimidazolesuccinocarboxamide synthase [Candidatus Roizmanbacteria bacterium]|nr:phosphoribosylaminoimidazolesuccinocarboxamide synthase [Candidatus Roizmanbacteria bacterium]
MTKEPDNGQSLPMPLTEVALPESWGWTRREGKVRDIYELGTDREGQELLALVATDRQSAFDQHLGYIPGRGEMLTATTAAWFNDTRGIIDNHMVSVPDPNVMIVRKAETVPIEMVVRGVVTGTTKTSIWHRYEQGEREFGDITLPDGVQKNEPLPWPIVDPTTKSAEHDEKLTEAEILERGIVSPLEWQALKAISLALFDRGQRIANDRAGLLLVDTKYEFGFVEDDRGYHIIAIDEIHTTDSSRFWDARNLQRRRIQGLEPENYDKEFIRLYYTQELGYRGDGPAPEMPEHIIREAVRRNIHVYERIVKRRYQPPVGDVNQRIVTNLERWGQDNL